MIQPLKRRYKTSDIIELYILLNAFEYVVSWPKISGTTSRCCLRLALFIGASDSN